MVDRVSYIWRFYDDVIQGRINSNELIRKCTVRYKDVYSNNPESIASCVRTQIDLMFIKYRIERKERHQMINFKREVAYIPEHQEIPISSDITIGMVKENPELWNDWHRQQKK